MKVIRWLLCTPSAILLSFITWTLAIRLFSHTSYGFSLIDDLFGLLPLVLRTAIPAAVFVVAGCWISPSKGRKVVFLFFALSVLFSGGGIEVMTATAKEDTVLWLTAMTGITLGSLIGMLASLRSQRWRMERLNKKPESNLASVTPADAQESRLP